MVASSMGNGNACARGGAAAGAGKGAQYKRGLEEGQRCGSGG